MELTPRQIAEAFSGHRFDRTFPYLADDVRWSLVGAEPLDGRAAVIAACEQSAAELSGVTTTFEPFKVVVGEGSVVVESVGRYVDDEGAESVVASCDVYDFAGDRLTAVTSYTVELSR